MSRAAVETSVDELARSRERSEPMGGEPLQSNRIVRVVLYTERKRYR